MTTQTATRQTTNASGPALMLWQPEDVLRWLALTGLSLVLWVTGWYLASGEASFQRQMTPANLAVGALVVFGGANVVWIMRGRRAVGRRIRESLDRYDAPLVDGLHGQVSPVGPKAQYIALVDARLFHDPACLLVSGRAAPVLSMASEQDHLKGGRKPCGICLG